MSENYSKAQVSTTFSGNDTLTATRGQHTVKVGVDFRRVGNNEGNSVDGTLAYTSEANLLTNHLNSIQVTAPLNDRGLRKNQIAGYAQDQWKVTPAFTVNYGLRYNYFGPFYEKHNNADPFDFASCGGYCGIGAQFSRAECDWPIGSVGSLGLLVVSRLAARSFREFLAKHVEWVLRLR